MSLLSRIARKIARRFRPKGVLAAEMARPGRNFRGVTAVDLWVHRFRFVETPAKRAGVKRAAAREQAQRQQNTKRRRFWQ